MSLFDDVLRARFGGLFGDPPPGISRPAPSAPAMAGPVSVPAGAPGVVKPLGNSVMDRLGRGVAEAIGGARDPRLSTAENDAAQKQAMLQAGIAMLAGSYNPNGAAPGLGQILAGGLMQGQGAGEAARERAYLRTAEDRIDQALRDPEVIGALTPRQLAMIRAAPPALAMELLTKLAFAPEADPIVLSAGAKAVDRSGRLIAENPQADDVNLPSDLIGLATLMGVDPRQVASLPEERRAALLSAWDKLGQGRATRVSVNTGEQTAKGVTQIALGDYEGIVGQAAQAQSRLGSLAVMDALLSGGLPTGKLEDMTQGLRGVAASVGLGDAETLGQQQLFRGLANKLALEVKGGMTGPMSDNDIKFLRAQVPDLQNTVEGNRLLVGILQRLAERDMALAAEANRYIAENGTLDHRWLQHKQEWLRNQEFFADLRAPF